MKFRYNSDHGVNCCDSDAGALSFDLRLSKLSEHMAACRLSEFEGDVQFPQLGFYVYVLGPGQPMAMYHWEADQEGFLVLSGEALLIVEGEERLPRAWDFVHCPPNTNHVIVGAGDVPCVVVAVGARERSVDNPDWGGYLVDEVALKHGAGVEQETNEPDVAYANVNPKREQTRYGDGWLPSGS